MSWDFWLGLLTGAAGAAGGVTLLAHRRLAAWTASRQEALEREERAEETRRHLLADVSHELATPLTAIRGGAETLLDATIPLRETERNQLVGDILAASNRMQVLIEDLFDLTRLEAGAVDLRTERLDWSSLCRHLVDRYGARFSEMGLSLQYAGPAEPAWVEADGRRLEQVLENLLANALRYVTAPGRVRVVLKTVSSPDGQARHRLRVVDDGPGFPTADLSRLFDRFYKSDRDRSSPGSGLGLAIVKELAERHGGSVVAGNRDPGRGTGAVVTLELPAAEPPA
ncbi:MAG: HAMP domain-containing sensor histidine kinase [Acidobacteriota bacterium]